MLKRAKLLPIVVLVLGLACAQGQTNPTPEPGQDSSAASGPPQATAPAASTTSVPLVGIDDAGLQSQTVGSWYYKPLVYGLEQLGSNIEGGGGTAIGSITRGYGALELSRTWRHYGLSLGYLGGGTLYSAGSDKLQQAQHAAMQQEVNWNKGRLQAADVFSYLQQSGFGGLPFGGLGLFDLGIGNFLSLVSLTHFGLLNPSQFASFANTPRISNVAIVEADQQLSSRSSLTALVSDGRLHFFSSGLLDDQQNLAELGYNYQLSNRSTIAVAGAYQVFGIGGVSSALSNEFANVIYQRQVSRRLSFVAGGGPLWTTFSKVFSAPGRQLSGMGLATVAYELRRSRLALNFLSYENAGSGYLVGAHTNRVTLGVEHEFSRNWIGDMNAGYARSTALEQLTVLIFKLPVRSGFDSSYVNLHLTRQLNEHLLAFATYTLTDEKFDAASTSCFTPTCGVNTKLQEGGVGLIWTPAARRLP
ncbi:MAG TPA: hypothetical protein VEK33_00880 [Terriglobales bacterium]|nr:hypothetical protein [Terriglobales bacterium]